MIDNHVDALQPCGILNDIDIDMKGTNGQNSFPQNNRKLRYDQNPRTLEVPKKYNLFLVQKDAEFYIKSA